MVGEHLRSDQYINLKLSILNFLCKGINTPSIKRLVKRQWQVPIDLYLPLPMTLWNRGINFGASQCIQWNQFDTAAAAQSVHSLKIHLGYKCRKTLPVTLYGHVTGLFNGKLMGFL